LPTMKWCSPGTARAMAATQPANCAWSAAERGVCELPYG